MTLTHELNILDSLKTFNYPKMARNVNTFTAFNWSSFSFFDSALENAQLFRLVFHMNFILKRVIDVLQPLYFLLCFLDVVLQRPGNCCFPIHKE